MDTGLLAAGIALGIAGAILLALIYFYPETARLGKRLARSLTNRGQAAGLRGQYRFEQDPSKWGSIGGFGTYEPVDTEDRALFAVVGSKIEGDAAMFANEMLWTDARLVWIGLPLLLIGVAACLLSAIS